MKLLLVCLSACLLVCLSGPAGVRYPRSRSGAGQKCGVYCLPSNQLRIHRNPIPATRQISAIREQGDAAMTPQRIGILHPGEMGISIAASARNGGNEVYWGLRGACAATHDRAAKSRPARCPDCAELCAECAIIVSVCPPHAAEAVANQVLAAGFTGALSGCECDIATACNSNEPDHDHSWRRICGWRIIGGPAGNLVAHGSTWPVRAPRMPPLVSRPARGYPRAWSGDWPSVGAQDVLRRIFEGHHRAAVRHLATAENLGVREDLYQQWAHDGGDSRGAGTRACTPRHR